MVAPVLLPALWATTPALSTLPPNTAEALGFLPVQALVLNPGRGKGLVPCAAPTDLPSPGGGRTVRFTPFHGQDPAQTRTATARNGCWRHLSNHGHVTTSCSREFMLQKKRFSGAMEVVEAAACPSAGLTPPG